MELNNNTHHNKSVLEASQHMALSCSVFRRISKMKNLDLSSLKCAYWHLTAFHCSLCLARNTVRNCPNAERNGRGPEKKSVFDFCKHELCLVWPYVSLKNRQRKIKGYFFIWEKIGEKVSFSPRKIPIYRFFLLDVSFVFMLKTVIISSLLYLWKAILTLDCISKVNRSRKDLIKKLKLGKDLWFKKNMENVIINPWYYI